jgi:hypothetical protein
MWLKGSSGRKVPRRWPPETFFELAGNQDSLAALSSHEGRCAPKVFETPQSPSRPTVRGFFLILHRILAVALQLRLYFGINPSEALFTYSPSQLGAPSLIPRQGRPLSLTRDIRSSCGAQGPLRPGASFPAPGSGGGSPVSSLLESSRSFCRALPPNSCDTGWPSLGRVSPAAT